MQSVQCYSCSMTTAGTLAVGAATWSVPRIRSLACATCIEDDGGYCVNDCPIKKQALQITLLFLSDGEKKMVMYVMVVPY